MIELSIPLHPPSPPAVSMLPSPSTPLLNSMRKFVRPIRGKTFPTLHSCNTKFQNGVVLKILKTTMSPPLKISKILKMSKFIFAKPQQFLPTTCVFQLLNQTSALPVQFTFCLQVLIDMVVDTSNSAAHFNHLLYATKVRFTYRECYFT